MINRILMELYDEYEKNDINGLIEFAKKTFPSDGPDNLFIGCVLILFDNANGFKSRYFCVRENLYSIVLSTKEKIGNGNLLDYYNDRINNKKIINKYLKEVVKSDKLEEYANCILDYLDHFKWDFVKDVKNNKSIDKYIKTFD